MHMPTTIWQLSIIALYTCLEDVSCFGHAGAEWRKRAESMEAEVADLRQLLSLPRPSIASTASALLADQAARQQPPTFGAVSGKRPRNLHRCNGRGLIAVNTFLGSSLDACVDDMYQQPVCQIVQSGKPHMSSLYLHHGCPQI